MTNEPSGNLIPNYAYVSVAMFSKFLEILTKSRPDRIDNKFLVTYGIPDGSAFTVISALKFLDIIDDNGKVKNPQLLIRLGNQRERMAALRELVDLAYAPLLSQNQLETATINDIDLFFQYQEMSPNVSIKAARFFMWLAQEAGYKVGEPVQPVIGRTRPTTITRVPVRQIQSEAPSESEVQFNTPEVGGEESGFTDYEIELLQITLANLKESKQVPDTDLLRELQKLIASVKKKSPT